MPITKNQFGKFEDVLFLEFGTGDILFTNAREQEEKFESMLIFSQSHPKPVGETTDEYRGKVTDELPEVKMVMKFNNPESITALVHSLMELQKKVFELQNSQIK